MLLSEAKQILKKNGYIIEEAKSLDQYSAAERGKWYTYAVNHGWEKKPNNPAKFNEFLDAWDAAEANNASKEIDNEPAYFEAEIDGYDASSEFNTERKAINWVKRALKSSPDSEWTIMAKDENDNELYTVGSSYSGDCIEDL